MNKLGNISKQSKILIIVIALFLVISVGYAIFSQSIEVKGTASAEGDFNIIFERINQIAGQGSQNATAEIINQGKELQINVPKLEYPTAYSTFNVTVKNNSSMAAKVTGIQTNGIESEDIKVTYTGVNTGDILNINEEKEVEIRVTWDRNSTNTYVQANFTIAITYEQVTGSVSTTSSSAPEQSDLFTWDGPTVVSGLTEKGIEEVKQNGGHLVIPEGVTEIADANVNVSLAGIDLSSIDKGFSPYTIGKLGTGASQEEINKYNIIKTISFPSTIKKIGKGAFIGCTNLTNGINLPSGLQEIGDAAFIQSNINGVLNIPNTVTTIGAYAFGVSNITGALVIPDSVTEIGFYAFYTNYTISSISFGKNLKVIPEAAFAGVRALIEELYIPDTIEEIKARAFNPGPNRISVSKNTKYDDSAFYSGATVTIRD